MAEDDIPVEEKPDAPTLAPVMPAWLQTAAEPAVTTPRPTPSGGGPVLFDPMNQTSDLAKGLAPEKAREAASLDAVRSQTIGQAERDMAEARRARDAISYNSKDMKSWDEQEMSRKFSTNPLQAFGSLGSVFGILASAFTHAPMENALNASAAAMNAIHAGDAREYERSYSAWKDNTNLALKRYAMERDRYQDSIELMKTNMGVGRAKMEAIAASYNDQKTLFLLRNGLDEDLIKLQSARAKSAEEMLKAQQQIEEHGFGWGMYQAHPLGPNRRTEVDEPDPFKRAAGYTQAYRESFGIKEKSLELEAFSQANWDSIQKNGRPLSGQETTEFHNMFTWGGRPKSAAQQQTMELERQFRAGEIDYPVYMEKLREVQEAEKKRSAAAGKNAEIERRVAEYMKPVDQGGKGLTQTAAYDLASKEVQASQGAGGNADLTPTRIRAQAIKADRDKLIAEGIDPAEASRQAEAKNPAPMTGSQQQKVAEKKQKIDNIVNQIDRVQQLIAEANKKGQYLVGIPGRAGTVWEFVDRDGKKTPHAEFTQLIRVIQSETMPILTGTTRLTKLGESARDEMIPGLGNLRNANQVTNAMTTLKKVLKGEDLLAPVPDEKSAAPTGGSTSTQPRWQRGVVITPAPTASPATAEGP